MNNNLGNKIREIRKKHGESITETASAIRVGRPYLSMIENGHRTVISRRVIANLCSHFSLSQEEATELIRLAGQYHMASHLHRKAKVEMRRKGVNKMKKTEQKATGQNDQLQIKVPDELPIFYSDSVWITSSRWGIVFDFAQVMASTNRQNVVARVGMSKEHAKAMFEVLKKKLSEKPSKK